MVKTTGLHCVKSWKFEDPLEDIGFSFFQSLAKESMQTKYERIEFATGRKGMPCAEVHTGRLGSRTIC